MLTIPPIHGQNIVVYDIEIINAVGEHHPELNRPLTWDDHEQMGVAVACAYSFKTGDYHVFFEKDVSQLQSLLCEADMVSGFNILGFDNRILQKGYAVPRRLDALCYDMLLHSRLSAGWRPTDRFPKGMSLDEHLKAMFGMQKTENAADAPAMFKRGEIGRVVSYCLADVRREMLLLSHVWTHGWFATETHGRRQVLMHPFDVMNKIVSIKQEARSDDEIRSLASPWIDGTGHD